MTRCVKYETYKINKGLTSDMIYVCHNVKNTHCHIWLNRESMAHVFSHYDGGSETSIEKKRTNVTENDCNLNTRQPR